MLVTPEMGEWRARGGRVPGSEPLSAMSPAPALLPYAALLLLALGLAESCTNVTSLSQQLDLLLATYEREAAPARPQTVRLVFEPRHAALSHEGNMHVLGDLIMTWSDPRIQWNATDWGCDALVAATDRLWAPDVELLNGAGGGASAALSARVTSAGLVSLVLRLDASIPVRVDLAGWPADRQTAVLKFGSRTHTIEDLDLDIDKITTAVIFEKGSWELEQVFGELSSQGQRRIAAWTTSLRRRAAAHDAATGAVLAAAVLTLVTAALLPPSARAPLCACASFTAALWLISALLRLPASSTTPTALSVFCAVCVCGAAGGAGAALVARVARNPTQPPRALRALASAFSALCRLTPIEAAEVGAWAALAQLLDYVLLAALLLAVFVAVCVYL